MDKVPSTIITCCILHNICLEVNDGTEIDVASDEDGFFGVTLPGHDILKCGLKCIFLKCRWCKTKEHYKRHFVLKL